MDSKYSQMNESVETYDDIGDIMHHRFILYALEKLWKKLGMIETSFEQPWYQTKESVDILRIALESDDIWKEFLDIIRRYISKARNIKWVQWNAKLLTSFVLSWREIEFRVRATPESLQSIFSQKIYELIRTGSDEEAYNIWNESMNFVRWINTLTQKNIIPINSNGEFIFGIKDGTDFFWSFQVVSTSGEIQLIDTNWNILSEEEIDKKNIAGLRKKKEFLLDCIEYFEWRKSINDRNTIAVKLHNLGIDIEHNSREEMLRDIKNKLGETESQLWRPQLKLVRNV